MIKCKNCDLVKELDDMVRDSTMKNGYKNLCKECNRLKTKSYREENKNYNKEYYSREDVKKRQTEYMKKYTNDNKDKLKVQKFLWREENKDKIKLQKKEYRKRNCWFEKN
jgi:hypothetical protein